MRMPYDCMTWQRCVYVIEGGRGGREERASVIADDK